jgi:hypothetical protein
MAKVETARARLRRAISALPAAPARYALNKVPPPPQELIDEVVEAMKDLEHALATKNGATEGPRPAARARQRLRT